MACGNITFQSEEERHLSELRILLVGSVKSGKSSAANIILGHDSFNTKRTSQCLKGHGEVAGRKVTVVEAPGWWSDVRVEDSTNLLKQEIVLSALQCPPGPHAVLLFVRFKLNFTDIDRQILEGHLNLFGDQVWSHTIVLFTSEDSLGKVTIKHSIENAKGKAVKWLVEKSGNRYHAFMTKQRDCLQATELLEEIEKMVEGNGGRHFDNDTKIFRELEDRTRAEEARSMERRLKVSKQRDDIRQHMRETHHYAEINILLLGRRNAGKSSAGSIILRREEFNLNRAVECVRRERNPVRKITVVEAPGWWSDKSTNLLQQEIVRSVSMFAPHAVLLVVNGGRRFTDNDRLILAGCVKLLCDKIWSHTIVLFTFGDYLGDMTIERHIESEGEALRWLVEKCGNRYHVFNNKKMSDEAQVIELLEKIEEMLAGNEGCHRMEVEPVMTVKTRRKRKGKKLLLEDFTGAMPQLSEVRLVLLGCRAAGKSSAGNTILGHSKFHSERGTECVKKQGRVAGREITVIEAPGWQREKAMKQLLKQEVVLSVSMCPPGPHAVLLVLNLDLKSQQSDADSFKGYMKLLTEKAWSHSLVLFTFGDRMKDQTIEQYIERKGKALRWLIEKCGQRYHVFDNKNQHDGAQVTELLRKIEEMVAGNSSSYLELNPAVIEKVKSRMKAEKKRSNERSRMVSRRRLYARMRFWGVMRRLSEVRIVLLGCRNAGKSSSASTILGEAKSTFNQSGKCVKRLGEVAGRTATVVEAPGWPRNHAKRNSFELLRQEIQLSVSMCPPGPHVVLLVVCLDLAFRDKHRNVLVQYLNLLGYRVWHHTIVLFTCGDSLKGMTIERHIESEGKALQWLVEKCGNRYHVFNNQNRHDNSQVKELLEKIEMMVGENRGCGLEQNLAIVKERQKQAEMVKSLKSQDVNYYPECYVALAASHFPVEEQGPERDFPQSTKYLYSQLKPTIDYLHFQSLDTHIAHLGPKIVPTPFSKSSHSWHSLREFEILKMKKEVTVLRGDRKEPVSQRTRVPNLAITGPVTSSLVKNRSGDNKHRIPSAPANTFQCRFTNLVFEMERAGEVVVRIVNWDSHGMDGLGKRELAGPLYNIECLEGSILYLHLPHCETCKEQVELNVAHMTGGNVEILQPLIVTETHVIIDIQGLSFFGLLRAWMFQVNPIKAQVLLFYNKERSTLYIHLLPGNVPVEEVQKRHESNTTYITTSSKCQLTPGVKCRPCCETSVRDYVSEPEDEEFDSDYGPNYHPTFQLLFYTEVPSITLSLLDEKGEVVWKPRTVLLKGTERATPRIDSTGADIVDRHREELILKVISVMEIADCLISKKMITTEAYNTIHEKSPSQEQMRLLYKSLDSGGSTVKAEFYQILRNKHPFLVDELESGSSLD